ncbi:WG repeat-containing protein [Sedimentibacter sp. MB31-C6]|uniref:WG repeat-containing protein n=1 Tax=Sedimentibacter sp. MB31-C6 TaxID=3109366 RepID=UPI002DDD11ED|nr:WG repeat-containing protein [Sedimentibacter sp. MB36-C1]WSI04810.1 WG repeat-containing protein [Sedimentibacter sp. MB36-C1]
MQNCTVYHGVGRFKVEKGKHGYINNKGEVTIPAVYDDAETIPYRGLFKVSKRGKWGLVNNENKILIPFKYEFLCTSYENDFIVCGKKKTVKKLVDESLSNKLDYDVKWDLYDNEFDLIVKTELDEKPYYFKVEYNTNVIWPKLKKYYILKSKSKFGVLCEDGRLITDISLSKSEAENLINTLCS